MNPNAKEVPFQEQYTLFVGFDWASDHHDAVAVDASGQVVLELTLEDTAEGWAILRQKLIERVGPNLSKAAVAVETCNGPAVERLLEMGCRVYPLNPKAAQRYRERKAPVGGKSDRLDAWSFADALRTDGHGWRCLVSDDPLTQELRILCRDEVQLIQQRTALVVQLRAALHEYYPAALEAFDDWLSDASWAFVEAFPTPQALVKAGRRRWEKFLHVHKLYRPETYAHRLEIFARADQFAGPPAVTSAKSRLVVALTAQLRVLAKQLQGYRRTIDELFARHPDHDIFGSLPGAGPKLAPRLLSEVGDNRQRFEDAQAIQCFAGSAPVTEESGKKRRVHFRRGCNKHLRTATHLWANLSRETCAWAQAYYQHKKDQGMSHACALRCLAQRWLKILWKMWQTRTTYDEALHTQNQIKHGSWVLALT
ncbi:MAG: IS110 family transposase [Chloroflexi bacterium]|nr:IS110 family transposase [Chloroflexota bacterium]